MVFQYIEKPTRTLQECKPNVSPIDGKRNAHSVIFSYARLEISLIISLNSAEPLPRERIAMSVAKKIGLGLIIVIGFGIIVANQVPKIERSF